MIQYKNKYIYTASLFLILIMVVLAYAHSQNMLIFSHKKHFTRKHNVPDIDNCFPCHTNMEESKKATDRNLPDMNSCIEICHNGQEASNECNTCHLDVDNIEIIPNPEREIKFNHKRHSFSKSEEGEEKFTCTFCHKGLEKVDYATKSNLPIMVTCDKCHNGIKASADCNYCHTKQVKPKEHNEQWEHKHALEARVNLSSCESCHQQDICLDCHYQKNIEPISHDNNYYYTHATDAKLHTTECYLCHLQEDYCQRCHIEEMTMPLNHSISEWRHKDHKYDAEDDIRNCTICHNESFCSKCH